MAKQRKVLPARKQGDRSRDDESLLMRSAESLGRMIGTLQRQLDGATKRLSETADDVMDVLPEMPAVGGTGARKGGGRKTTKSARKRTAAATTRRAGARKAPTQARKRQGASKASKKR